MANQNGMHFSFSFYSLLLSIALNRKHAVTSDAQMCAEAVAFPTFH